MGVNGPPLSRERPGPGISSGDPSALLVRSRCDLRTLFEHEPQGSGAEFSKLPLFFRGQLLELLKSDSAAAFGFEELLDRCERTDRASRRDRHGIPLRLARLIGGRHDAGALSSATDDDEDLVLDRRTRVRKRLVVDAP